MPQVFLFGCMAVIISLMAAIPAAAGLPDGWTQGGSWTLRAVYRQPDGTWSAPVDWHFSVLTADAASVQIGTAGATGGSATLRFDRQTAQLVSVETVDRIKGQAIQRTFVFDGPAPVYPLHTAIPFHFAVMTDDLGAGSYTLKRKLNDRSVGTERLDQDQSMVSHGQLLADLPDAAAADPLLLTGRNGEENLLRFDVTKRSQPVFAQYWVDGLPWAVFTRSPTVQAWLVKETP